MNQTFWGDLINYGVPLLAGVVGVFAGHKITLSRIKQALVNLGPEFLHLVEKLAADAKAVVTAPVHAIEDTPGVIEAHKTDVENAGLEIAKYALLGLTAMNKAYGAMNDAEKFALAQFVDNSVNVVLPKALQVHVTPGAIAKGIAQAQGLLDGANADPLLAAALKLTQLATAVQEQPQQSA